MRWIKEALQLLRYRSSQEQKEFDQYNNLLVLARIRVISWAAMFLPIFWIYMDWTFIQSGADRNYSVTLIILHCISVFVSAIILIFYEKIIDNKNHRALFFITKTYVFLYILFGAISSVNSQRYTDNIYTYLVLSMIAAVAFTLKPSYMLFSFVINHIIFLVGIRIYNKDSILFLTKFTNSSVLIGAAFLLGFIFYRNRVVEFLYRKKLVENEENFKKLFYFNPYPVFITKLVDGTIIEANKKACNLMGIQEHNMEGFSGIDQYIKNDMKEEITKELMMHNSMSGRILAYDFNGKQMWVTANYELIDYRGERCILTGIMDITEIRKAEEELAHYASTDSLTGILNRRMGFIKLEELLTEAKTGFLEFVLCFLDINNLKYVNDTYGHSEGDHYILALCKIISDKLGEEDIFFRLGGDEFIIVFRDKSKSQVEEIWDEMIKLFDQSNQQHNLPYNIMASHGLFYCCSGMDLDIEQIIEQADMQMYKEKQRFREDYHANDEMEFID